MQLILPSWSTSANTTNAKANANEVHAADVNNTPTRRVPRRQGSREPRMESSIRHSSLVGCLLLLSIKLTTELISNKCGQQKGYIYPKTDPRVEKSKPQSQQLERFGKG